jgi:peroxiredoxin Q/BCP
MTQKLLAGTQAPDFALLNSEGQKVSLSDYRGRNVIVYFYPEAATPGCTTEACDFRDSLSSLQSSGYEVLGISPDAPEKIASFAGDYSLTFPLLSDEDHAVALAYGAWGEKLVHGEVVDGLVRSTVSLPTAAARSHIGRFGPTLTHIWSPPGKALLQINLQEGSIFFGQK